MAARFLALSEPTVSVNNAARFLFGQPAEPDLCFDMWNSPFTGRYLPIAGYWKKNIQLSLHIFPFQPSDIVHMNTSSSYWLQLYEEPDKDTYVIRYIKKDESGRPSGTKKIYIRFNSDQSEQCIAHMEQLGCVYIDRPVGDDYCENEEARNRGYHAHGACPCGDCGRCWTLQEP